MVHIAAAHGYVDILALALERFPFAVDFANSRGQTPLHVAAMKGEFEAAQMLIDYGSDCDAPDLQGNSPLHYASSWGRVNVRYPFLSCPSRSSRKSRSQVLKLLVDFDCATDSRNSEGFTAAEYAYSFGVLRELEDVRLSLTIVQDTR